jgi:hypothetical protein
MLDRGLSAFRLPLRNNPYWQQHPSICWEYTNEHGFPAVRCILEDAAHMRWLWEYCQNELDAAVSSTCLSSAIMKRRLMRRGRTIWWRMRRTG